MFLSQALLPEQPVPKMYRKNQKSNVYYARNITPKRVMSEGDHLRGLAPGQHRNIAAVTSRRQQCPVWPAGESNARSPAPTAMSWITVSNQIVFQLSKHENDLLQLENLRLPTEEFERRKKELLEKQEDELK